MRYEWFIAKRYLWSKRRHPFVGVINLISVLGIGVGVAALVVVLAVMNGFDEELKNRIVGTRAHLVVEKEGVFKDFEEVMAAARGLRQVRGAAPYVEGQALIQKGEWAAGVLARGIDPAREKQVSKFYDYLVQGTFSGGPNRVVVGSELARRFALSLGSSVSILSSVSTRPLPCEVEGIFSSGMYEYDANLVFLDWRAAQALFGLEKAVSGTAFSLREAEDAGRVKTLLQRKLGFPYFVRTWMDMNKTLFGALKLEKIVMFLILALIILVASLNIAGSLTILVMDKTKDIGVLKALGAAKWDLVRIFTMDGLFLGGAGALAGLLAGMGISWVLKTYPVVELPKEIYYTNRLPVQMDWADAFLVAGVAMALSLASAFYPARLASKLDVVKALRYE